MTQPFRLHRKTRWRNRVNADSQQIGTLHYHKATAFEHEPTQHNRGDENLCEIFDDKANIFNFGLHPQVFQHIVGNDTSDKECRTMAEEFLLALREQER